MKIMSIARACGFFSIGLILQALSASGADERQTAPHALTSAEVETLLAPGGSWFKDGSFFSLEGLGLKLAEKNGSAVTLAVSVDRRLDLWKGRSNDLASKHGGEMSIVVDAVVDETGQDVFDHASEKPWSGSVSVDNPAPGVFSASRMLYLVSGAAEAKLKEIKGRIVLSLPVDWASFEIDAAAPKPVEHPLLSGLEVSDGRLSLKHPAPVKPLAVNVLGFDAEGKYVPVTASGVAGSKPDNHWFDFKKGAPVKTIVFALTGTFVRKEVPFVIPIKN